MTYRGTILSGVVVSDGADRPTEDTAVEVRPAGAAETPVLDVTGHPPKVGDGWIAAGARRHGIPLVTYNRRHFERIPRRAAVSGGWREAPVQRLSYFYNPRLAR
jgi:hypothetical protein